jgi:hypothetical protein
MPKNPFRIGVVIFATAALSLLWTAGASAQSSGEKRYFRGFYLGAMYSSISNPTFRLPSGSGELPIPQSASVPTFMLGYDIGGGGFGIGARLLYLHAGFTTFVTSDMPNSPYPNFAKYTDPGFSHISFDILLHWLPFPDLTLGIYGLLGMASSTEKYLISGASFPDWNGNKSLSEFDYSYGLGLRFSPIKMLSVFAEFRLIAGDLVTEYTGYLYSDDTYNYYKNARSYTKNTSSMLSIGLSVNF